MQITLTSGTVVKIKNINLSAGSADWRRVSGEYTGDCVSYVSVTDLATAEQSIKEALDAEGI